MQINHTLAAAALMLASLAGQAASITVTGAGSKPVLTETPPSSTGLNALFVAYEMAGVTAAYQAASASATVKFFRYSNLGGGYAEEVVNGITADGTLHTLIDLEGDMGYIVEEDGLQTCYFWIVDYSLHRYSAVTLTEQESECLTTTLAFQGEAKAISYYSIAGRQTTLSRGITAQYQTLEFDEDAYEYLVTDRTIELDYIDSSVRLEAPLCATTVTLTGDRFLAAWDEEVEIESTQLTPYAVECQTMAEQDWDNTPDNLAGGSNAGELGGSAPAVVTFKAVVTDAAIFNEWQFSSSSAFDDIDLRITDLEFTHTFTDMGITYVRFVCDNSAGQCEQQGTVYSISVGESSLLCPNAFSPGASEGTNDVWKVSYRSIVEFECHIFNRWGKEMCSFKDPSQGWDGRHNGKLVPAGAYYYVIKARGSDGRKYNLAGDINIVNYK